MKKMKCKIIILCVFLCMAVTSLPVAAATAQLTLSEEENALISRTQTGNPLKIGILPHTFPLAECPPVTPDFCGINVEMLKMITQVSGLEFEYCRVPIEEKSPYQALLDGDVPLVAGTIRLDAFVKNPELLLSDRFCDGSAICIAGKNINPVNPITGKIAVMSGYQAGIEFATERFPQYELVLYSSNEDVMRAVRRGEADLCMISRYVGLYELLNPFNEDLTELDPFQTKKDSCIMGINTPENRVAFSVINKALAVIGEDGYNYVQMNFSISHPYKLTVLQFIYKYRHLLFVVAAAFIGVAFLTMRLLYAQREHQKLSMDSLTGAYSEAGFELAVAKIIPKASKQLFITDFDIAHFSSYNELNGKAKGDDLLKGTVKIVRSLLCEEDIICRSYADHFKVLSCKDSVENLMADIQNFVIRANEFAQSPIALNFGVYPVNDREVPISKMLDFATIAKKSIKSNPDIMIGVFDETLLERQIREARMTAAFTGAVANKEFVAYYQPKVDAATKELIGAEALVRWIDKDGTLIPPIQFIELFEKSGQIQALDFYMLREVCSFLRERANRGLHNVPIAVNFSRVHLYSGEFVQQVNRIVEEFRIPKSLIEIECTETTMTNNIELAQEILGELQAQGFSIAMDDFGSAFSSLNTLCSMPLDVIKLDGGFLKATLSHEKARAKTIISSVISLAHSLSLRIVAEGVETVEQYVFLRGLGCDFIQGYYFSKPLDEKTFTERLEESQVKID